MGREEVNRSSSALRRDRSLERVVRSSEPSLAFLS